MLISVTVYIVSVLAVVALAAWICYVCLNLSVLLPTFRVPLAPLDLLDSLVALEPRYNYAQHDSHQQLPFLMSFIFLNLPPHVILLYPISSSVLSSVQERL